MSTAMVYSRTHDGVGAPLIRVEVDISKGIPSFSIVGLPETAIKESRDRVRSALLNVNHEMPVRRILVNLSPADLPKEGARFDLPIAIGILAASQQIRADQLEQYEFAGELGLAGELRPINGMLPFGIESHKASHTLICPAENAAEAMLGGGKVLAASHLLDVISHVQGWELLQSPAPLTLPEHASCTLDIADIQGQPLAKRALLIAAAGGHSMLMCDHQVPAKACWLNDYPPFCRHCLMHNRWKLRPSTRSASKVFMSRDSKSVLSGRRIILHLLFH